MIAQPSRPRPTRLAVPAVVTGVVVAVVVALALAVGLLFGPLATTVRGDEPPTTLVGSAAGPTQGTGLPGAYLTADLGSWQPEPPEGYEFRWLRDGVPIAGATARDYLVQPADAGHAVAPEVTAHREGYQPGTLTGTPVTVRELTTTLTLDVKRARPPGKRRLVWTAISYLTVEQGWAAEGTVTVVKVEDDRRKVLSAGPVVRNTAVVRLPWRRAPEGRTKLVACYGGAEAVAPSCSPVDVVRRPHRH